jgi:hypothetical protein
VRQPKAKPSVESSTGAAAKPSVPPKAWIAKARPVRWGDTRLDRIEKSAGWNTEFPAPAMRASGNSIQKSVAKAMPPMPTDKAVVPQASDTRPP